MFEDRTMTPDREAIADAAGDAIDRVSQGVNDVLDQADDARQAAAARGRSLIDRLLALADDLALTIRSVRRSAERSADQASAATAQSIHETRKRARASAEAATSMAGDAASLGGRAWRTAAIAGESARESMKRAAEDARHALEDARDNAGDIANLDRARQAVGDAIGGSAAERLRGPRTTGRMRAGLVATGIAAGAAATYFLDPEHGADRRRTAGEQLRSWSRSARERLETMTLDASSETRTRAAAVVSGTAVLAIGLARGGLLGATAATGGALVALGGATNIGPSRLLGTSTSVEAGEPAPAAQFPDATAWSPTDGDAYGDTTSDRVMSSQVDEPGVTRGDAAADSTDVAPESAEAAQEWTEGDGPTGA